LKLEDGTVLEEVPRVERKRDRITNELVQKETELIRRREGLGKKTSAMQHAKTRGSVQPGSVVGGDEKHFREGAQVECRKTSAEAWIPAKVMLVDPGISSIK
jgi:hypothetical protein